MEYRTVAEARSLSGLRLALTAGGPGPWSEAAKAVFAIKGVRFTAVQQDAGEPNEALLEWTGHRNAPVAVYEGETPRAGWCEILLLAERMADEPRLLPAAGEERALAIGLCHEICGEAGLGWSRRLLMLDETLAERVRQGKQPGRMGFMANLYGHTPARASAARRRVVALLEMLAARLRRQAARGHEFFLGDSLSAVDLYWACFAAMFSPLPHERCPMPDGLRALYTVRDPAVRAALAPELLAHRDRIYENSLPLPLDF